MSNLERAINRTERLFNIILQLQGRPNMTSRDLAEYFGVSRRTIFRDLRTLSESGVPLTYAEGGGYEILDGYQLPPLMFTAREAATLLMGAEFMKLQSDPSLRKDADQVDLKIREVLPPSIGSYVDRLKQRTVLDPYWIHATAAEDESDEGGWYELSHAVAEHFAVVMEYLVMSRGEVTRRTVHPLALVYYTDHWNLIAFDLLRNDIRNFRLDHILSMRVTSERFEPPAEFNLQRYLEERATPSNMNRVRLRFSARAYRLARTRIPARVVEEVEDGKEIEVSFQTESLEYLARWMLSFGGEVRAVEPDALRVLVRKEAERILTANA